MKYAPKLSHPLSLIKQKLISTPPPHNDDIKANPPTPLKKSPPIGSLITRLLGGFLPPVHTSESLDSELVWSSHKLGESSSSTAVSVGNAIYKDTSYLFTTCVARGCTKSRV